MSGNRLVGQEMLNVDSKLPALLALNSAMPPESQRARPHLLLFHLVEMGISGREGGTQTSKSRYHWSDRNIAFDILTCAALMNYPLSNSILVPLLVQCKPPLGGAPGLFFNSGEDGTRSGTTLTEKEKGRT